MKRTTLLQQLIDAGKYKTYLEIGTNRGMSLFPIKCKQKIAIDPKFKISRKDRYKWIMTNPSNLNNKYFELTSDQFFEGQEKFLLEKGKIDVIFIDGLHTFEASLKDVLNSLKYLNRSGVMVMHDCFPPHKAASTPLNSFQEGKTKSIEGWNGEWCGDVWKTIVYLKENFENILDVYVLDTDFGLGIIKFRNDKPLDLKIHKESFDRINELDYEHLISNPKVVIGLSDKSRASDLVNSVRKN